MIIEACFSSIPFTVASCYAEIEFTLPLVTRILQLNRAVKKVKAFYIVECDDTPVWLDDEDGSPWMFNGKKGRYEGTTIRVFNNRVKWYSYLKGDNIAFYTDEIGIEEITEIYKALTTPKTLLPNLLWSESEEVIKIITRRLKDDG